MSTSTQHTSGVSFRRARVVRVASGVASAGVLAALGLVGATPASADPICDVANTVDGAAGPGAVQALIDLNVAEICLTGTFNFAANSPLTYTSALTLYGLPSAVLDGKTVSNMLQGDGDLTVQNLTFQNGSASDGGAINGTAVTVIDSVFDGNVASVLGGAILGSNVLVEGSVFQHNEATFGGAIAAFTLNADVTVSTSTFYDNYAEEGGGAIASYGLVSSSASTFNENVSDQSGGAIVSYGVYVQNSTFVHNTAANNGGAIATGYGSVTQSTFLENEADDDSGQSIYKTDDSEFDLQANIFAGSTAGEQLGASESPFTDDGANLFTTPGEGAIATPAASTVFGLTSALIFGGNVLADNGGPTQTVALPAGSVAIDSVPVAEATVTEDQRGVARGALSDSGAYEYVGMTPVIAATGAVPATWLGGIAGLLLAMGAVAFGFARRAARTH